MLIRRKLYASYLLLTAGPYCYITQKSSVSNDDKFCSLETLWNHLLAFRGVENIINIAESFTSLSCRKSEIIRLIVVSASLEQEPYVS